MVVLVDRRGRPLTSSLRPNPAEVVQTQWTSATELASAIDPAPWAFSPWLVERFPMLVPHIAEQLSEAGEND